MFVEAFFFSRKTPLRFSKGSRMFLWKLRLLMQMDLKEGTQEVQAQDLELETRQTAGMHKIEAEQALTDRTLQAVVELGTRKTSLAMQIMEKSKKLWACRATRRKWICFGHSRQRESSSAGKRR